jgi:hypothetical protein
MSGLVAEGLHAAGVFRLEGAPGEKAYFSLETQVESIARLWTANGGRFVPDDAPDEPWPVAWYDYEPKESIAYSGRTGLSQGPITLQGALSVPSGVTIGRNITGVLRASLLYPVFADSGFRNERRDVQLPCQVSVNEPSRLRTLVVGLSSRDSQRADQQGGLLWLIPMAVGAGSIAFGAFVAKSR